MRNFKKNSYFLTMRNGFATIFSKFFNKQKVEDSGKITDWILHRLEMASDDKNSLKQEFTLATMLNAERILLRNLIIREEFDKIILVLETFIATNYPDIIALELKTLTEAIGDKKEICQREKTISSSLKEIVHSLFNEHLPEAELLLVYNLLGDASSVNQVNDGELES